MSNDPLIGRVIDGRYEIRSVLGRGGMAVVYRAFQPNMDREVAIKMILSNLAGADEAERDEFIMRFQREARTIAKLEHPYILPVYDYGEYEGQIYLVMRILETGDLKDRIMAGMLPVAESLRMLGQIAQALTHAHEAGIIHRDLKPQNVLIDTNNNCYLTDFGIAKATNATSEMTAAGTLMGTPAYMAPEQWRTHPVDARTDIYALGVIAYNMLTGALPFNADTPFGLMYKHLDEMPPPLERYNTQLPPGVTTVIFRAIAKKPADRYPTATQFIEELTRAASGDTEFTLAPSTFSPDADTSTNFETYLSDAEQRAVLASEPTAHMTLAQEAQADVQEAAAPMSQPTDISQARTMVQDTPRASGSPRGALIWGVLVLVVGAFIAAFLVLGGDDADDDADAESVLEDGQALVIADSATLYAAPNTASEAIATVQDGAELDVLGLLPGQGWALVAYNNREGWAQTDDLRIFGEEIAQVRPSETPTPTDTPQPSDTPTATPSDTPTATPSDTPTATPSDTPTPTLSPTPQEAGARVTVARGILYAQPDTTSAEVSIAPEGAQLAILRRSADGLWYEVEFLGNRGWILTQQVDASGPVDAVEVFVSPTPSNTPSPTPTATFTPTETLSPTATFTPTETPTQTPSPTPNVPTAVPCTLTAEQAEVNVRSQPNTTGASDIVENLFGGDTAIATARTTDGWFLTARGWVFETVVRAEPELICARLPIVGTVGAVATPSTNRDVLCEVIVSQAALYERPSFGASILAEVAPDGPVPVWRVVRGAEGTIWYQIDITRAVDDLFLQGWVPDTAAGPAAGRCPEPTTGTALFGNPNINPLALDEPDYAEDFSRPTDDWSLLAPFGSINIQDGALVAEVPPRGSTSIVANADPVAATQRDIFVTTAFSVPDAPEGGFFVELILRGFYSVRVSERGEIAIVAENDPSLVYASTGEGALDPQAGGTLGVRLAGARIQVFADGMPVLDVEDDTRAEGILLRVRLVNRDTEATLRVVLDEFAFWNLSAD